MKEDSGAYPITVGECLICEQHDEHWQDGEPILGCDKNLWTMAKVIPHDRIKLFGAIGD